MMQNLIAKILIQIKIPVNQFFKFIPFQIQEKLYHVLWLHEFR